MLKKTLYNAVLIVGILFLVSYAVWWIHAFVILAFILTSNIFWGVAYAYCLDVANARFVNEVAEQGIISYMINSLPYVLYTLCAVVLIHFARSAFISKNKHGYL
jgi:hypothetical protein